MLDLAIHDQKEYRLVKDIAASQAISEKYVGRLIIKLRAAGLVKSQRGVHGGFQLNRAPEKITLLEIVEAMEGAVNVVSCVNTPSRCKRAEGCAARTVWSDVNAALREKMQSITLQDVADIHAKQNAVWAYSI
jgi:Rrf2 family protein